jgi:hypothetical protein
MSKIEIHFLECFYTMQPDNMSEFNNRIVINTEYFVVSFNGRENWNPFEKNAIVIMLIDFYNSSAIFSAKMSGEYNTIAVMKATHATYANDFHFNIFLLNDFKLSDERLRTAKERSETIHAYVKYDFSAITFMTKQFC